MGTLKAGVQYNDWKGSSAADDAFSTNIGEIVDKRGIGKPGEHVVAVELWSGENDGLPLKPPYVHIYFAEGTGFDSVKAKIDSTTEALDLRKVEVELSLEEFVALFKRFNVVLTRKGLGLDGREYTE